MIDRLHALRELLTQPANWTQHSFGRDKDGRMLGTGTHPLSVCWCLLGGIDKVCPEGTHVRRPTRLAIMKAITQRYQNRTFGFIHDFNDDADTTHEMVLEVIDRAIAAA